MIDNKPLISVVTVSYNAASTIEETILSIINQTYKNIEYIVIDGGSTDGTVDIIRKYVDRLAYWTSESDRGIYDAMNKGIVKSSGEWVHFLNAGDIYLNTHVLEDFMRCYSEKRVNADVLYGEIVCKFKFGYLLLKPASLNVFSSYFPISHPAALVKGNILKENIFDITYRISGDYELFYRLYLKMCIFEYLPIPLALFDAVTGVSSTNPVLLFQESLRIQFKSGIKKYYYDLVALRIRMFFSKVLNVLLVSESIKMKYQKCRLLKNNRFSEIDLKKMI